ncbi:hypothetical protein IQ06DRAFT_75325 [Phaeosphaeriaceae sp. SRC1lsM3a]|nr:hypothetical protein IQ06DRAFT_75325 [Stagonospora sp. SRC1lsM3a]
MTPPRSSTHKYAHHLNSHWNTQACTLYVTAICHARAIGSDSPLFARQLPESRTRYESMCPPHALSSHNLPAGEFDLRLHALGSSHGHAYSQLRESGVGEAYPLPLPGLWREVRASPTSASPLVSVAQFVGTLWIYWLLTTWAWLLPNALRVSGSARKGPWSLFHQQ